MTFVSICCLEFLYVDVTASYLWSTHRECVRNVVPGVQVFVEIAGYGHTSSCQGWRIICVYGLSVHEGGCEFDMCMFLLFVNVFVHVVGRPGRRAWIRKGHDSENQNAEASLVNHKACTPLPELCHSCSISFFWVFVFSGSEVTNQEQVFPWGAGPYWVCTGWAQEPMATVSCLLTHTSCNYRGTVLVHTGFPWAP